MIQLNFGSISHRKMSLSGAKARLDEFVEGIFIAALVGVLFQSQLAIPQAYRVYKARFLFLCPEQLDLGHINLHGTLRFADSKVTADL